METYLPIRLFLKAKKRFAWSMLLAVSVLSIATPGLTEDLNKTTSPSTDSLPKNSIQATVSLGAGVFPSAVAISPNSQTIYVSSWSSSGSVVSVIDSQTGSITSTIPITGTPGDLGISPDGSTLYVLVRVNSSTSVYAISTATGIVTTTFNVPAAFLAVSPNGKHIFLGGGGGRGISIIDTVTNKVHLTAIRTPDFSSSGIALSPNGQTAYVAGGGVAFGTGALVIDLATRTVTATISAPSYDDLYLTLNPNGSRLYINYGSGNAEKLNRELLEVVDASTNQAIKTFALTKSGTAATYGQPGITPDGKFLYAPVTSTQTTSMVLVIEPGTSKIVDSITLAPDSVVGTVAVAPTAPFACAIANVGNNDEGELFIIDISPE
jgi:DNA-binding beta-propeller fold protein YncE